MIVIRLIISGRSYHLAQEIPARWELAEENTLDDFLVLINARLPAPLPASCLVAVSGTHLGTVGQHKPRVLHDGDEVVLIAPVAGG